MNSNSSAPTQAWSYAVPKKALMRWAKECVSIQNKENGVLEALFKYSGSTCSNMGHPILVDFVVHLSPIQNESVKDYKILDTACHPSEGDTGCYRMCSSLAEPQAFLVGLDSHQPLIGKTLNESLEWSPEISVEGCLCMRSSQNHKWRNAFQAIHYHLNNSSAI